MKITITENDLKQMIAESVNNMLNESRYDDSPILKWVYWCYNYPNPQKWIPAIWGNGVMGNHMMQKFNEASSVSSRHPMEEFIIELSIDNQKKLIDYVMNNF